MQATSGPRTASWPRDPRGRADLDSLQPGRWAAALIGGLVGAATCAALLLLRVARDAAIGWRSIEVWPPGAEWSLLATVFWVLISASAGWRARQMLAESHATRRRVERGLRGGAEGAILGTFAVLWAAALLVFATVLVTQNQHLALYAIALLLPPFFVSPIAALGGMLVGAVLLRRTGSWPVPAWEMTVATDTGDLLRPGVWSCALTGAVVATLAGGTLLALPATSGALDAHVLAFCAAILAPVGAWSGVRARAALVDDAGHADRFNTGSGGGLSAAVAAVFSLCLGLAGLVTVGAVTGLLPPEAWLLVVGCLILPVVGLLPTAVLGSLVGMAIAWRTRHWTLPETKADLVIREWPSTPA
jgi:hypothetical protein